MADQFCVRVQELASIAVKVAIVPWLGAVMLRLEQYLSATHTQDTQVGWILRYYTSFSILICSPCRCYSSTECSTSAPWPKQWAASTSARSLWRNASTSGWSWSRRRTIPM